LFHCQEIKIWNYAPTSSSSFFWSLGNIGRCEKIWQHCQAQHTRENIELSQQKRTLVRSVASLILLCMCLWKMEEVCRHIPYETCTFGLILNAECHLKRYTRRVGLYSYADWQNENKGLLLMKCEPKTKVQESATVCFHHEKILLSKYHLLQKIVVIHSKTIRRLLEKDFDRCLLMMQNCSINV
jgi:hypothetical protein